MITKSTKNVYLLRNKLICGYCGKPISAESGTTRAGKRISYYKSIGIKKYKNDCIKETIRQDMLEELVLNVITSELSKPQVINAIVKQLLDMQDMPNNSTLTMLEKNKKHTETTLDNIMKAIEQGIVNKTTNKRMQELEQQIEELEKQILIEKSKTSTKLSEQDIKKFYKEALLQGPLILIQTLVKEIKLYNDKMEITFNSPITKSPEPSQNFCLTFIIETKN